MAASRTLKQNGLRNPKRYVKGAILRIKLENFLTYDDVEFTPGPQLNVIIGPNGTGKSSIVCAIVLALAGRTQILGRAKDPIEYIKHGCPTASVELELRNDDGDNYIIKRILTKRERASRWLLNNRSVPMKNIEELAATLNIQVGNLCQFLPQDKVDEFSKMNMIELLESTEKAVGGMDMFESHERLKSSRDDTRTQEVELRRTREGLEQEVTKNARLDSDVEALRQKQSHLDKISILEMKIKWVAYEEKRNAYLEAKTRKDEVEVQLKHQKDLNKPLKDKMDAIGKAIGAADTNNKRMVELVRENAYAAADKSKKIEDESELLSDIVNDFDNKKKEDVDRESKLQELNDQLKSLQDELRNVDVRDVQPQLQRVNNQMRNVNNELTEIHQLGLVQRSQKRDFETDIGGIQIELKKLQDVNNQRMAMLRSRSRDAYTAVQWLRANLNQFTGIIHEPIMTVINVHEPANVKYVESHIAFKDMLAFVCEDSDDQAKLLEILREQQKLRINVVGAPPPELNMAPSRPISVMECFGFRAYLSELFSCPDAVMRYLCQMYHVHKIPVGNHNTKSRVHDFIAKCQDLRIFYTQNHKYAISKSRYSGQSSSSCREIREGTLLTKNFDSVRDQQLKTELAQKQKDLSRIDLDTNNAKKNYQKHEAHMNTLRTEKKELLEKKDVERVLTQKIKSKEQTISIRQKEAGNIEQEKAKFEAEIAKIVSRKFRLVEEMRKQTVSAMQTAQAKVKLHFKRIYLMREGEKLTDEFHQKNSAVSSLTTELESIKNDLNDQKNTARNLLITAKKATNTASSDELSEKLTKAFKEIKSSTLEELENVIHEEKAKAHMCSREELDNNNILQEYNTRKDKISELERKVTSLDKHLTRHKNDLENAKLNWYNPVVQMVSDINTKFSYLFAEMKCAGEITLHVPENTEDYGQYGVKIMVKYRDSEPLQELSAQLHSGGERSVATVLYMLALQEMATCPFRCVDEINQGMDPHNERKVFDLVVNISCKKNTSQYFLLTPKLLPDLKYGDHMTILCVANGPYMMHHKDWSIRNFIKRRQEIGEDG